MNEQDRFTASEALYAFVGQITTSDKVVEAGATKDSAIWANLVSDFCKRHELAEPRDGWDNDIVCSEENK